MKLRSFVRLYEFLAAVCFFIALGLGGAGTLWAESPSGAEKIPFFTWNLSWLGSLRDSLKTEDTDFSSGSGFFSGAVLFNRLDLDLSLPRQDLSFRFLATDRRPLPFGYENSGAIFNPAFGLYHYESGSRFLFGVQNEYGLPSRIRNIWLRSVPFMEHRSPSGRDLKTEVSSRDNGELYLYLALPPRILKGFNVFASAAFDKEKNPAFGTGFGFGGKGGRFLFEGFYTQKTLPQQNGQRWFSASPPLPERDFRIGALGIIFDLPFAAFASDWTWSETFAWGSGLYGNFALRIGNRPWRFSISGDGAGGRFTDRDGSAVGTAARLALKAERFWPASGLLRFQGVFRSSGLGEDFERASLSLYFRPSASRAASGKTSTFRFSRASLGFSRNAETPEKTSDTLDAVLGIRFGFLTSAFSCSYHGLSRLDAGSGIPPLYQARLFEMFDSFKVSGELGWKARIFELKTRAGITTRPDREPVWDLSFNGSLRPGRWGRLGLRVASTDFPEKWNYTLSWRFETRFL